MVGIGELDRGEPERFNAQCLEVIELFVDTIDIAEAIIVAIGEGRDHNLVADAGGEEVGRGLGLAGVLVPFDVVVFGITIGDVGAVIVVEGIGDRGARPGGRHVDFVLDDEDMVGLAAVVAKLHRVVLEADLEVAAIVGPEARIGETGRGFDDLQADVGRGGEGHVDVLELLLFGVPARFVMGVKVDIDVSAADVFHRRVARRALAVGARGAAVPIKARAFAGVGFIGEGPNVPNVIGGVAVLVHGAVIVTVIMVIKVARFAVFGEGLHVFVHLFLGGVGSFFLRPSGVEGKVLLGHRGAPREGGIGLVVGELGVVVLVPAEETIARADRLFGGG